MEYLNQSMAILLVRVFLGLVLLLQGYDKVFRIKISGILENFEYPMLSQYFPKFLLVLTAYFTSFTELIGGFLLILGLFKSYVLVLVGCDLMMASLAFGLVKPMWDMQHVFFRLALVVFLLVMPVNLDIFSLDHLIH